MRLPPYLQVSALHLVAVSVLLNCAFVAAPVFSQNYGDVTVRKNPDGSIETYDSSGSSVPSPRRSSRSAYRRSSQKYNDGVVVRKNADGSIETFDSGDAAPARRSSGKNSSGSAVKYRTTSNESTGSKSKTAKPATPPKSNAGSSGVHKFVHKYDKGVTVKKNPDGTIEVSGYTGGKSGENDKSQSSVKSGNAAKSSSSSRTAVVRKAVSRTARRPRGHGNYGDVRVIRNPDGSIETYDAN